MGYNSIAHGVDFLTLETPWVSMALTVRIILEDAKQYHLDPAKDFGALLKCWNTGGPTGKTFDPLYVLKGMQKDEAETLIRTLDSVFSAIDRALIVDTVSLVNEWLAKNSIPEVVVSRDALDKR